MKPTILRVIGPGFLNQVPHIGFRDPYIMYSLDLSVTQIPNSCGARSATPETHRPHIFFEGPYYMKVHLLALKGIITMNPS